MLGKPVLNVLESPKQSLRTRQPANRRKGSWIARRVTANASNRLVEAFRQLIDRQ